MKITVADPFDAPDSVRSNLYYARKVLAKRLGKAFGRSALAIAALLFGGSLLYAAAVVAGFAPSPFAAAEPVAEDAEFDFNAKNTENTEDADLTGKNAYNTQHNRRKERIHGNRKSTRWKAVCGKSARTV